jgi:hypothetical protein
LIQKRKSTRLASATTAPLFNYHEQQQKIRSIHTILVLLRFSLNLIHQEPTLNALALQPTPLTLSRGPPLLLTSNAVLSRAGRAARLNEEPVPASA